MASLGDARNVEAGSSILERLRAAYEEHGFSFVVEPGPETLPDFLGSYRPDAIARKKGENVIIEIMRRQRSPWEEPFADLHDRIAGHKDWKLNVVYAVERPEDSIVLPVAHLDTLNLQIAEVEGLQAGGHHRAAFMLAWSVLEAVLNRLDEAGSHHIRTAGQVVHSLAMGGHLSSEVERRLFRLSELRNRIVHGDLDVSVSGENVELVLAAIKEALAGETR